ncbi:ATP-NAD kinase family protein [Acetobacterium sp.]|uniref:ATP-NAD kinase family protein n=1 Tax=Acetobacterium sp. TaxID=1872094 RepID=UPI002F3E524C
MASIGIIANPASGKDIRRLVSHATVIDNNEKINIVERIILGAQECGVNKVYIMPDPYHMGYRVIDTLETSGELKCNIVVIDIDTVDGIEDTINSVRFMNEKNVGCIITLGGDGTNRAVAKEIKDIPLIAISTGTNNVYPVMIEGTIAGIAAGVVASGKFNKALCTIKDKLIEVYKEDKLMDIALIDAVISRDVFVGARALWDIETIEKIFVARSHPASIGFSAVIGSKMIIREEDDFGAYVSVNKNGSCVLAPMAAGIVLPIATDQPILLSLNETFEFTTFCRGTIALDGEREIEFHEDQNFGFKITRNGPYHIDIRKAIEVGQMNGFFNVCKVKED